MSETPRELLVWGEFVASDGYVFGSGVRSATDDEVRAAVVPLLKLEAAVEIVRELIDRIPPVLDFPRDATTWTLGIVCAALGLGEDTEGGEE